MAIENNRKLLQYLILPWWVSCLTRIFNRLKISVSFKVSTLDKNLKTKIENKISHKLVEFFSL